MPATLIRTCPLCGLRFSNLPLLELHIREDHRQRERQPARDDDDSANTSDSTGRPEAPEAQGQPSDPAR